jgi:tetratricopeptide (TPR) repeat protein
MQNINITSIKKWIFLFIVFPLITLGILEGYLRIFSPVAKFNNHTTSAFGIPTAFRVNLNSNQLFGEFPFQIKTDSHHLRNFRQTSYQKTKNTFRILCLGGSIFAASGVNNDETFAYFLEQTLKRQFPEQNFEVINTAKNSWEIAEFYTYIKNEGFKFAPDLIISYFHTGELSTMDFSKLEADSLNVKRVDNKKVEIEIKGLDFNQRLNNSSVFLLNFIQSLPLYDTLFNNSHLVRLVEIKIRKNLIFEKNSSRDSTKINLETSINQWEIKSDDIIDWKTDYGEIKNTQVGQLESILYSVALEKFNELIKNLGSNLSFLIIPSPQETLKLQIYPKNLLPLKFNSKSDFTLINLLAPLTNFQNSNFIPLNFPKVIHWTPAGHHTAAKLVYNALINKDLFLRKKISGEKTLDMKASGLIDSIKNTNNRISKQLVDTGHDSFIKGIVNLNQNRLDLAGKFLKRSLQINPNDNEIIWRLANLHYQKSEFQKSLNLIEGATQANFPLTDEVYALIAKNFFKLKDYKKAEIFFLKSINQSPANALNHFNFANFLFLQKRIKEAIVEFTKADHFYPNNIDTLLLLGSAHYISGNKLKAIKIFEKALQLDPRNPSIYKTLSNLKIKLRKK